MGFITCRASAVSIYFAELLTRGMPAIKGDSDGPVLFVLDGVGGFQFAPILARRALHGQNGAPATAYYRWQWGLPGEIFTDLMWLRHNRVMGARLARRLLAHRRTHPTSAIHLLATSGGAGIGVFALEALRGRPMVETLVLACPALSPTYDLAPALRCVHRAYALVSHKDSVILGMGTRLLGTTDRRRTNSAGRVGFRVPRHANDEDRAAYENLREIHWTPQLKPLGHPGGHTGWLSCRLLRTHLLPLLQGNPQLPTRPVPMDHPPT